MKRLLPVVVASLLLWLILRNIDISVVIDAIAAISPGVLLGTAILFLLTCALGTTKWRLLWKKAGWWEMLGAGFASLFYSMVLPGQLGGEVAKALRVGITHNDTAAVSASVILDKATSLVALLTLACVGAALSDSSAAARVSTLVAVVAGVLVCLLCLLMWPPVVKTLICRLESVSIAPGTWSRCVAAFNAFLRAWQQQAQRPYILVGAIALGILYQLLVVSMNVVVAAALDVRVEFVDWCWILGLIAVALLLPITVAGLGVREASYVGLLALLDVPAERAIAIALLMFATSLLGAVLGALFELVSYARYKSNPA